VRDLPTEVTAQTSQSRDLRQTANTSTALALYERLVNHGESFWSAVYEPFAAHDLTRDDLRTILRLGLEHTRGSYKQLVQLFNMAPEDYKRFLNFLRKHQCHMPFQRFRALPARADRAAAASPSKAVNF
jgi:hypothetical protein